MKKLSYKKNCLYTTTWVHNDEADIPDQIDHVKTNPKIILGGILVGICLIALVIGGCL